MQWKIFNRFEKATALRWSEASYSEVMHLLTCSPKSVTRQVRFLLLLSGPIFTESFRE
jgi:hypothetical protein